MDVDLQYKVEKRPERSCIENNDNDSDCNHEISDDDNQDIGTNNEDSDNDNQDMQTSYEDSDDEDFFIRSNVMNFPITKTITFTPKDEFLHTLALSIRHKWTYESLLDVMISKNLSFGAKYLPTTKEALWSALQRNDDAITGHMYCSRCQHYFGEVGKKTAENCQCDLSDEAQPQLHFSYFYTFDLSLQIENLFKQPNIIEHLQYRFSRQQKNLNALEDIYDGEEYKRLCAPGKFLSNPYNFSFIFNTDGCTVSHSSKASAWPIYVSINELPPHLRKKYIMLAGIYVDKKQPLMNNYLRPFTTQINRLYKQGIKWRPTETSEQVSKFLVLIGSVDSPARAKVLRMKQYNSYYGCSMCYARSDNVGRRNVYKSSWCNTKLREDKDTRAQMIEAFEEKKIIKGIKGPSALLLLPEFDLCKGMVVESMHAVFLGVTRQHMNLLLNKPQNSVKSCGNSTKNNKTPEYYIGSPDNKKRIDQRLLSIQPSSRRSRLPRSIETINLWKASELRNWLEYSVVCLNGILQHKYLKHLSLLAEAIYILNSDSITSTDLDKADKNLLEYVKLFEEYFSLKNMSFNVHLLTHLTDTVRNWGPLWVHTAFSFESWNRKVVEKITSPHSPCNQIINRYLITKFIIHSVWDETISIETQKMIKKLLKIPLKIENSLEWLKSPGKVQLCKPTDVEKCILKKSGYSPNSFQFFKKASITGVSYKCDGIKKTKFCDSIVSCTTVGFGRIIKFVKFKSQQKNVEGIFLQLFKELKSTIEVHFIKEIQESDEICFVELHEIIGPAVEILSEEKTFVFKLPNHWETD